MILLACSKRSEIIAAPERPVTPCAHTCHGVCTVGACKPYELARLEGAPRAIAVNATKVVIATDRGLEVVDKKTHTVRHLKDACKGDAALAVDEKEAFLVRCGSAIGAIDLGVGYSRSVAALTMGIIPERIVATDGRVAWVGGGRLEVVTTGGDPVRVVPRDVAHVALVEDRIYWSQTDESIWKAHGNEAPERIVQGYDARGPFAATEQGVFWPNRHDRTLVRLVAGDKWPQWLGYDPLSNLSLQAVADREWLYYRQPHTLRRIGHAHWSEPTAIAEDAVDMATDGTTLFYLTEHEGTLVMALDP